MFHKSSSPQGQELLADHCRRQALLNRDTHTVFALTHSHYTRKHNISGISHFKIVIATTHTQACWTASYTNLWSRAALITHSVHQDTVCLINRWLIQQRTILYEGPALSSFTGLCYIFPALLQVKPALDCLSVTLISGWPCSHPELMRHWEWTPLQREERYVIYISFGENVPLNCFHWVDSIYKDLPYWTDLNESFTQPLVTIAVNYGTSCIAVLKKNPTFAFHRKKKK